MPQSAVGSIAPALEHTKEQLFRPFRFGQWARLALVGLVAGEMTSGACNVHTPARPTQPPSHYGMGTPDWALVFSLIAVALIVIPILWLLFLYLNSRMRFVLFDSVVAKECRFEPMWRARRAPALQYFLWQILFSVAVVAGIVLLLGVPALAAFFLGWFSAPRAHLAALVATGVLAGFAFLLWMLLSAVVHVFTKDFVVPQMALENLSVWAAWQRLWGMLESETSSFAGYAGLKLVLAIVAGAAVAALSVIVVLVLLIPFGGLGALFVLVRRGVGWSWDAFTITLAVVAACVFLAALLYGVALVSVPAIVFFPAYAIHFFAGRYRELARLIHPPPASLPPAPPLTPASGPI